MKSLFCYCLLTVFAFSFAQDGSPDLSFGNNGYITYEPEGEEHYIVGAIETNEGNILTVINTMDSPDTFFKIFAFTQEGLPHSEFGVDGVLDITGQFGYSSGIIKLNGEGFLLQGFNTNQLTLSKHFNDGTLDESFGSNGYLQPFLNGGSGSQVKVDNENRIIVSGIEGVSGIHHVLKKRFTENGQPDVSFGSNGQVLFPLNGMANLIVRSLKLKGDFYYSGINYNDNNQEYKSIIRSDLNGLIDTGFGVDGILQIPIETEYFTNFNVFENGTILIGGTFWDYVTENTIRKTIKINSEGQQIQSFGNNGQIIGRTGFHIQGNQRFIADASISDFEGGTYPSYFRYFPNGTIDNSFQFNSNYNDAIGTSKMLHLQSGKFMLISSDIWYNWPDIKITLQRFNNSPLSIPDIEQSKILVYPNPSSGIFHIQNETPFYNTPFEIFDSLGRNILSGHFNENSPSINLSNLESGVYFLKIADRSQTFKLLKR